MPSIDLRYIKVAKYTNTAGTVDYDTPASMGDAMTVNLELRYAEGRLYAESVLAEYIKKAIGGSISIGVKYIPDAVQKTLFGAEEVTRTISGTTSTSVTSLAIGKSSVGKYVGVAFYAPDVIDGTEKYSAVFIHKAKFGAPSMVFQTMGESIVFNTPTTTGEFLASDATGNYLIESATFATEAEAKAWIDAVLA